MTGSPEHGWVEPAAIPWADRDDALTSPAPGRAATRSARDLEILRSFAQRIPEGDASAHNNLGVVYYRRGLYAEAVEQFERALELDPNLNIAQRNLQIAYSAAGYYQQLARAEQADPSGSRAAELGSSDVETGACLSLDGYSVARHEELVGAGAAESRAREVIDILVDRLTVDPNDLSALVRLGDLLSKAGRGQEARVLYRRALRLDPTHSGARVGFERLALTPESQPGRA